MEVLESIPRPHSCPALVTSRHRDSHRSRPVPHRVVYSCFNNGHRRQEVLEILDTPTTSVDRHRNPTEHHVTAGRHRHPTEHHDTWPPHSRDEQNISSGHSYSKEQQISHSRSTSADHELPESARLRGEQHIEHRKCGSSHCEVCRPPLTDYRDLRQLPEPVLFVRWEKRGNCHSGATLRKVNYKVNGVGQVIRSVDKSCEGRVKESSQVIRRKVKVKLDTLRRQKVIARRDQDGLYYPAVVQQCSDPRHASVIYDDGTHAHVLTRNVIPTGGAVARPPLTSGDCVLMRVVNLDSDTECYVPAIVQHGPHRQEAHSKFFSVLMYNGQKASTLRSYLVKISKERFELASMYIADQHNENRKDVEDLVYVSSPRFPKKGKTSSRKSADTRCDLSFTCDLPFTCDLYINRDLLTRYDL
ncbi:uncharacterized protein LOC106014069 [Aplysia californica]|uniref:Uncharacterized protein LOC106014069 n=1 Tax=Aplysia californica TaxID=6500 RepID=A0ABM1AFA7_APLCA|nr:uncharacterized protein LOC106014069 [Aplysia californica]